MNPEERMALLKELTKLKPGSIDETKRAKALLRSLSQARDVKRPRPDVTGRTRPAIGRIVSTKSYRRDGSKRPRYDISFFNQDGSVNDKPFKGGSKDSKLKALKYMLGQAFDRDIPKNSMIDVEATDSRRANVYSRMTKGVLKFKKLTPMDWAESKTYKNKAGNYQPIVKGKFTKAIPSPGDALRDSLIKAASSPNPYLRFLKDRVPNYLRGTPAVNAIMMGADIGKYMRDNLDPYTGTSGRGSGRQALND